MKKQVFIFIITILLKQCFFGQGGFNKNYSFTYKNLTSYITDAFEAPNGNLIMVGVTLDTLNNQSFNHLTLIGTNSNGGELWRKSYGNYKFTYFNNGFTTRSVITDTNCFYLYSIVKDSTNAYFSVFIKFNYNGDTLWQKKYYDPTDALYIQSVCKTVDDGFLMTGFFEGTLETCMILKTDANGNELWRKKLNKGIAPDTQAGYRILQDSMTKKIVIAGYQYQSDFTQPGNFSSYANIIVADSLGVELQRKSYSGNCGSYFRDLIQTQDKNFVAVGYTDQCDNLGGVNGTRRNKSFAVKININNINVPIWQNEYDITSPSNGFSTINELANGNLILAGNIDTLKNHSIPDKDMMRLTKLDKNGTIIWNKLYSRDNAQKNSKFSVSLNICSNGDFLIANQLTYVFNNRPYSISRIDTMGCDSSAFYCSTVGIKELKNKNEELKIYPNPTSGNLIIELDNSYKVQVTNLLGEFVKEEDLKFTKQNIDISNLKNGIYFLKIFVKGNLVHTTKIIKE